MPETAYMECSDPGCDAKVKSHAWGRIKAEGWFFQKDGAAYCPLHVPSWVEAWRKKRADRG